MWDQDDETGARFGTYPEWGVGFCEGRLTALLHGSEDHRLASPSVLVDGSRAAAALLTRAGVHVHAEDAAVRRADLASDLEFEEPRRALSLLNGLASLDVPWGKIGTEGGKGLRLETVIVRHVRGRKVQERFYDKSLETGEGRASRLRLEHQGHYKGSRAIPVAEFAAMDHGRLAVGKLDRYLRENVVHVTTPSGAATVILDHLEAGKLSTRRAASMIGDLHVLDRLGPDAWSRSGYYRRSASWRALGIAIGDGLSCEGLDNVVPLADYFGQARQRWAA